MSIIKVRFPKHTELNIKRFYLPITLTAICPECGGKGEHDHTQQYISDPECGTKESIPFLCEKCDEWFDKEYMFNLIVELEDVDTTTDN
jgi:RecJ-like exonuclease